MSLVVTQLLVIPVSGLVSPLAHIRAGNQEKVTNISELEGGLENWRNIETEQNIIVIKLLVDWCDDFIFYSSFSLREAVKKKKF